MQPSRHHSTTERSLLACYYLLSSLQHRLGMSNLIKLNQTRALLVACHPGSNAGHIHDECGKFICIRLIDHVPAVRVPAADARSLLAPPLAMKAPNTSWRNVVVAKHITSSEWHVFFFGRACWHLMGCNKGLMAQMVFSKVLPVKPFLIARKSTPICSLV